MNKERGYIVELVKEHVQSLDPYAEIVLLFPQELVFFEDIQIYVLTIGKVDFGIEQQYLDACYKVKAQSGQSLSLNIYSKEEWHKKFKGAPTYQRVILEGVML